MTVLGRREAEFLAKNGTPKALQLARARLYNISGGVHVCDMFDNVSENDNAR
jgi:hypothetical protein